MRDETDPEFTKSFDMFVRGQEICTGGQRIHLAEDLRKSMRAAGIAENGMEQYLSAIDFGAPPHGGAGLGLERLVMLILNLGDVRNATLFHRDPKSLPEKPPALPHPEVDTTRHHDRDEVVPLEKLIANYGDASNTSWLDDRFELWRHNTGGVVGYVRQNKFAMITGDPLCDERQYHQVIQDFVTFVETELKLTPVWMLVSDEVQQILGRKLGWRTLTCTEEQRVDGGTHHEASGHDERRAEKEGVQVREITPDQDFIERAERSIEEWKAQRNDRGKQVHLTEVRPWVDQEHRRYFVAEKDQDGDRHIYALVVLAQLAPRHGWQVKWALDFPGSPSGIIEVVVSRALGAVSGPVTFGAGVSGKLKPGEHLGGVRAKFLARTYTAVATSLRLGKKSGFREKFGAKGEEVYICYPRHGVSVRDLDEIVKFFKD
ncbi:hypothetical protein EHS25_003831 [Saitozyma podzolica]|uniref:aspartate--tRNA ligase n=1 Tax=Saitozyma podzolica TaxID=1890683 RepID=A0A427Y3N2_9TREE|nr:hypothetical protein EHS25_003831 [Saitozyma podzolica]